MNLQIEKDKYLVDKLLAKGWRRLGHPTFDNHPYYMEGAFSIAIGQNIRINIKKTIEENIDSYFKRILSRMIKYNIKKFVVFGSLTGVSIPQYFKDFCIQNGIDIEFVPEEESIDNVINKILQ